MGLKDGLKIYCFGNEILEYDRLAKEISRKIKIEGVKFVDCESPLDIVDERDVVILDVVKGIDNPMIIDGTKALVNEIRTSLHDMDLGFFLRLKKETDTLDSVKIIGVPMHGNTDALAKQVKEIILQLQLTSKK